MTVKELKEKLVEYPENAEVCVSYSVKTCDGNCNPDGYCYCGYEEREEYVSYVCAKEASTKKEKNPTVKTVLINI